MNYKTMIFARFYFIKAIILSSSLVIIFLFSFLSLSAVEINWVEIANTDNEIQFIDSNSIKYNKSGFLSVITKNSKIDAEDKDIANLNAYLMLIDCENRLFNKLPINGKFSQVKSWIKPNDDKLTKKTIINTCAY